MFVWKLFSLSSIFSFKKKAGCLLACWSIWALNAQNKIPDDTLNMVYNKQTFAVYIFKAKAPKGTVLLLHGWHLPASDWWTKTHVIDTLIKNGFQVVCPDLDKCCYNDSVFSNTDPRYKNYPTRKWFRTALLNRLQKQGYFNPNQTNHVVGISTGSRGAALLLSDYPGLFNTAVLLSGDYDQTQMPNDGLMTACYGPYSKNKTRWLRTDNPVFYASKVLSRILLIHGKNDSIVPYQQSERYYHQLKSLNKKVEFVLVPNAGHDYILWSKQLLNYLHLMR